MAVTTSSGNGFALYNGVKLPNIDSVWDKNEYPYACLTNGGGLAALYFTDYQFTFDGEQIIKPAGNYLTVYVCATNDEAAEALDTPVGEWGFIASEADPSTFIANYLDWSSYDILSTDGSIYLSASDPIPLDGMNVIEWDGDTTGLTDLSSVGIDGQYLVADTFVDFKDGDKYVCVFWNGDEYVTYPQHTSLVYTKEEMGSEMMWLLGTEVGNINFVGGYNIPSYGVVGTSFLGASPFYTALFAYPASGESEPTYDRTAFLSGLAMGLCGKGNPTFEGSDVFSKGYLVGAELRAKRRIPVAYLYNGMRLPALPEWDKEKYPYALIHTSYRDGSLRDVVLHLLASNAYYTLTDNGKLWFGGSPNGTSDEKVEYISYGFSDNSWVLYSSKDDDCIRVFPPEGETSFGTTRYTTWTNFDAEYNGTLYRAASEPVPVYE